MQKKNKQIEYVCDWLCKVCKDGSRYILQIYKGRLLMKLHKLGKYNAPDTYWKEPHFWFKLPTG